MLRRLFYFAIVVDFFLSLFSPPNLRGRSLDRHQISTRVQHWPEFIKLGQKFGRRSTEKFGGPQTSKFGANFGQLPNWIVNISGTKWDITERKMVCNASCARVLMVNFGWEIAKNKTRVSTDPMRVSQFRSLYIIGLKFYSIPYTLSHYTCASTHIT